MRRLALISTVLLVLLVACEQTEPVEVTGTLYSSVVGPYEEVSGPVMWGSGERGSVLRGQVYSGTWDTSDERLSGEGESVVNCDMSESGDGEYVGECWGTITINNDGGSWEGTFEGTSSWTRSDPGHFHDMDVVLTGSGDYEGLQYVGNFTGVNPPWEMTGTIEVAN